MKFLNKIHLNNYFRLNSWYDSVNSILRTKSSGFSEETYYSKIIQMVLRYQGQDSFFVERKISLIKASHVLHRSTYNFRPSPLIDLLDGTVGIRLVENFDIF